MSKKNAKSGKKEKIKERKITVRVMKTIQEVDFEPFALLLAETVTYDNLKNGKKARKRLFKKLTMELNDFIDERWNDTESERETN